MRFLSSSLALFLTTTIAVSALPQTSSPPTTSLGCKDYVLVQARGTYEQQGESLGFRLMDQQVLSSVANGLLYNVVYDADISLNVNKGRDDLAVYIRSGVSACPRQKYIVMGYSQGAWVAALGLGNFTKGSSEYEAIKGVLVIGNGGHKPGEVANVDEKGGDSNRDKIGFLKGQTGVIPESYYADGKVKDICFTGDWLCADGTGSPGLIPGPHIQYGFDATVQQMGADFMTVKLAG